jgi:hypothetical protein
MAVTSSFTIACSGQLESVFIDSTLGLLEKTAIDIHLGVGSDDCQFGAEQSDAIHMSRGQFLLRGERFSFSIQHTTILENHHRSFDGKRIYLTADLIETEQQALFSVVSQHMLTNILLDLGQDLIALLYGDSTRVDLVKEQRFQVHFMV